MQVTDNIPQLDDFYHVPESIKSPVLKILYIHILQISLTKWIFPFSLI